MKISNLIRLWSFKVKSNLGLYLIHFSRLDWLFSKFTGPVCLADSWDGLEPTKTSLMSLKPHVPDGENKEELASNIDISLVKVAQNHMICYSGCMNTPSGTSNNQIILTIIFRIFRISKNFNFSRGKISFVFQKSAMVVLSPKNIIFFFIKKARGGGGGLLMKAVH